MLKVLVLVVLAATMAPSALSSAMPKHHAKSCYEIKEYLSASENGLYILYDSNESPYETYCDLESDAPFIWTLIESLSLEEAQKAENRKGFAVDYGLSQCRLTWSRFRVSKARMDTIRSSYGSTHYRATCNFNPENGTGLEHRRDYLRGHLCNNEYLFSANANYHCRTVEYINIRGQMCRRCPVAFKVSTTVHQHIGLTQSTACSTSIFTDAIASEDVFGQYNNPNPLFSCATNKDSTTNWWVGGAWITEAV